MENHGVTLTKEDIVRMAIDANNTADFDLNYAPLMSFIERFAALVAAAEREACAKVCDEKALKWSVYYIKQHYAATECAFDIRARGDK